jgi:drug/metabolite transporter (DMT)-like permease
MSKRGWILFLSLGLLWGMPYLLIRIAVQEIDPLVVAGTRTLIGSLLLLPVALHRDALRPAFRQWKWLLAFTLIEMSVPWVLLGHAETRLNSSTAGLLIAVVPLFAAVIVTRLGHERLEPRRMATVIYAPFAPFLWPEQFSAPAAWSVLGLGVLCTAGAFLVFFALIAEVGPARATVITYVNPAVAIALGALVLHEPLTIGMAIGFPLVIAGSILGTMRVRGSPAATPVTES